MNRLYIVGAGGFGREVFSWAKQCPEWNTRWKFAGFLDDNPAALSAFALTPGVVAPISGFVPVQGDQLICAIGDSRTRLRIARELQKRGGAFPVLRHPFSVIGEGCDFGQGTILCPGVVVTANVRVGEFVIVNICATIGHDARIGDGVTLSPHADVTGCAIVEEGAFLGSHASVIPKASVGAYARVGAGSVVFRSVNSGATVVGVPATQLMP
jgi:sugar O-acyltransferase (sialic acid O-acetyltransferase NeuD family)